MSGFAMVPFFGRRLLALSGAAALVVASLACQEAPQEDPATAEGQAASGAEEAAASGAEAQTANGAAVPMSMDDPAGVPSAGGLLDPNEATRAELVALPAVDEQTADAIVAGRPYDDMLQVDRVFAEHLSAAEREAVYRAIWKPLDLNTASAEEILLIPGVGDRMRHEFEEYRPYRAMAEFHREIGKYVDEEEVARLAQYVTIR